MGRAKKQIIEEAPAGAPDWMVTFSDCMTLLLTFFVLLLSFSSFDDKVYNKMKKTMLKDLDKVFKVKETLNAAIESRKIVEKDDPDKGSEKPTLSEKQKNSPEQTPDEDFRKRKVFISQSSKIFWGTSNKISTEGQNVLESLSEFLTKVQGKVLISENDHFNNDHMGLERSLNVLNYMIDHGVKKGRLSISAESTLTDMYAKDYFKGLGPNESKRKLEIIILERSIFD